MNQSLRQVVWNGLVAAIRTLNDRCGSAQFEQRSCLSAQDIAPRTHQALAWHGNVSCRTLPSEGRMPFVNAYLVVNVRIGLQQALHLAPVDKYSLDLCNLPFRVVLESGDN